MTRPLTPSSGGGIRSLGQIAAVTWIALSISVFIAYPGSRSVIHGTTLGNWAGWLASISRISGVSYLVSGLQALAGLIVFVAAFIGVGSTLLSRLPGFGTPRTLGLSDYLAHLASAFVVGAGVLSVAFLFLAIRDGLTRLNAALVIAAAVALAAAQAPAWIRPCGSGETASEHTPGAKQDSLLFVLSILVVILSLSYTTSRISFDATALYFSDAKITALTHSLHYFIEDRFVASIFQPGVNYASIIVLFGDQAARAYSWANGLAIIVLSLATAARLGFSKRACIVLLAMVVSTTAMLDMMGDGKIDLASTAPSLAAVYWIVAAPGQSRSDRLLGGFLAGLAMAARPFNLFLMPILLLLFETQRTLLSPHARLEDGYWQLFQRLAWIAIGVLPWLIYVLAANRLILGDPLAFLRDYQQLQSGAWALSFPADQVWQYRVLYPFAVTYINHGQSLGDISPLFVGLLPLGLFGAIRSRAKIRGASLHLVVAAAGTLVAWLAVTSMVFEIRYILVLWIILYMPIALWVDGALAGPADLVGRAARLAIATVLLFMLVRVAYISVDAYAPVDGQGNAHCHNLPRCAPLDLINQIAAPGDRVLTLSAFRYYLRTDLFACSTGNREYAQLDQLSHTDPVAFWTQVYQQGNRFAVIEADYVEGHLYFGMLPGPGNLPSWLTLLPLWGAPGDNEVSYQLVATDPPVRIEKQCIQQAGVWQVQRVPGFAGAP